MSLALRSFARRVLALALLAFLLVLAWIGVLQPLIRFATDRREEVTARYEQLSGLQNIIARKRGLEQQAEVLRTESPANGSLWKSGSAAAVAADIQNLLRKAIVSGGGQLRSTSEESGGTEQGFRRVYVRFDVQGPLQAIAAALDAVETASPLLFVDNLSIVAPETVVQQRPPLLTLNLRVVGYMRGDGS